MRCRFVLSVVLTWGVSFSVPTLAQIPTTSPAQPTQVDPGSRLVVGDSYNLRVERHGVKLNPSGIVMKVTDRWILLHSIRVQASVQVVPYIGDIPLIGRVFQRSKGTRVDEYIWVP